MKLAKAGDILPADEAVKLPPGSVVRGVDTGHVWERFPDGEWFMMACDRPMGGPGFWEDLRILDVGAPPREQR